MNLTPPATDETAPATPDGGPADQPPPAPAADDSAPSPSQPRHWLARFFLGRGDDPIWVRPALLALLTATGLLYLWGLGASGWANGYYSAAVQAGATSWKAFFFGSFDGASFITVDKTPASLWIMALSARLFGVNSWSILAPQALEGVATVAVLYATVRRWAGPNAGRIAGPAAGLIAGAVAATTPVAVLMFRFNNPDALLVLLLTIGAYCVVRATEIASWRWLALAGVAVGFAFLTKMLQAFLVLQVFSLVYLVAAPTSIRRRLGHLLAAGLAVVASAGWWIAIVELLPAKYRPYIGGSQNNSVLELTLGYNGLGRLTGEEVGSVGGGGGGGRWGDPGWFRLFGEDMGGQAAWLLPAALILLVAGLVFTLRTQRTNPERAAYLLWGGWLLANGLTFSLMKGIVHAYYTVALAPAIGALVGLGVVALLRRRSLPASICLAASALATAWCANDLLGRTPDWHPWLRWVIIALAAVAAVLVLADGWLAHRARSRATEPAPADSASPNPSAPERPVPQLHALAGRWLPGAVAVAGLCAALAGPVAYSLQTASTPHTGAIPSAGPGGGFGGGFGPGGGRPGQGQGDGRALGNANGDGNRSWGGAPGQGNPVRQRQGGGFGGNRAIPGAGNAAGAMPGGMPDGTGTAGELPGGMSGMPGGAGGLLDTRTPSAAVTAKLSENAEKYTWVLAAVGANSSAGYQLATGKPVLAIGGFNGSDAAPTLEQFKRYVAEKKIHYFAGGGGMMRADSGSNYGQQISTWVQATFPAVTIDGSTFYDLTQP
jgi:4-amino-4-deoxy-L-arabinose transferase-like glycosyltransferase